MKTSKLLKIFFATIVFTVTSFAIAGYSMQRAQIANPEALNQIAKHYNVASNGSSFHFFYSDDSDYTQNEKTWDFDGAATNMTASAKSMDFIVKPSADGKYHLHATGLFDAPKGKEILDVEMHDGDIFVSDDGHKSKKATLEVFIPEGKLKNLRLKTISGDMNLQNIRAEEVHTASVSGDVQLEATQAKYIEAKSTSGNIHVNNKIAATIEAKSVSGDVVLNSLEMDKANIALHSISGDIKNPFGSKADGKYKISVNTTSGDIELTSSKSQ